METVIVAGLSGFFGCFVGFLAGHYWGCRKEKERWQNSSPPCLPFDGESRKSKRTMWD